MFVFLILTSVNATNFLWGYICKYIQKVTLSDECIICKYIQKVPLIDECIVFDVFFGVSSYNKGWME